jgi:hypothetical protein
VTTRRCNSVPPCSRNAGEWDAGNRTGRNVIREEPLHPEYLVVAPTWIESDFFDHVGKRVGRDGGAPESTLGRPSSPRHRY